MHIPSMKSQHPHMHKRGDSPLKGHLACSISLLHSLLVSTPSDPFSAAPSFALHLLAHAISMPCSDCVKACDFTRTPILFA